MSSDPGAILPPMAFLTRAELGFPWPQTTATGFLWTSIATQMHSVLRDTDEQKRIDVDMVDERGGSVTRT